MHNRREKHQFSFRCLSGKKTAVRTQGGAIFLLFLLTLTRASNGRRSFVALLEASESSLGATEFMGTLFLIALLDKVCSFLCVLRAWGQSVNGSGTGSSDLRCVCEPLCAQAIIYKWHCKLHHPRFKEFCGTGEDTAVCHLNGALGSKL